MISPWGGTGVRKPLRLDRDKHVSLYCFIPLFTAAKVRPVSLLSLTQVTPSFETVLMLSLSSSKNNISWYGTPVAA